MANPTLKVGTAVKMFNDNRNLWYFVGGATNAKTYVNGQMVGTPRMGASKAGYVTDFDDSKALIFLGMLDMPSGSFTEVTSTTADNVVQCYFDAPQWLNYPLASGTASRATDIGKPVYAVFAGTVTLDPTATTYQNLVGYVVDVDSGTTYPGYPQTLTGPNVWIEPAYMSTGLSGQGLSWKQDPIAFAQLRKPADFGTTLPNAGTSGILGVVEGTYGTTEPTVKTFNAMGVTTSNGARFMYDVPPSYIAGSPMSVSVTGYMSVAASVSAVLQVDAYRYAAPTVNVAPGSGGTQTNNVLVAATKTFTITPTTVVPGDRLDVRVQWTINDGGSTPMNGIITSITVNLSY